MFRHRRDQVVFNLLIVYVLVILASTFLARTIINNHSFSDLTNFDLINTWITRATGSDFDKYEFLLNFVMLLPAGFLFAWSTKKGFLQTVLFGFLLTFSIELAQLLSKRGWFELADIVDNIIGVAIGYGLFHAGAWLWQKLKCLQMNNPRS